MPNEGLVYIWGSVPSSLFRGFDSLWMVQDMRRQHLEVYGQVLVM